nr:coiled-coil domain-containing protein 39-like [Onthophagus taurus]
MDVRNILEKIGWTNGFHVPIANAENQALEEEVKRLTDRKAKAKINFDDATAKCESMDKHLKYIKQESEQNQKLMTAYTQQIASERQRLIESKSQQERINQEMRQINKHIEDIEHRQSGKRADLAKTLAKIDKLKSETIWDVEALKAWEESLKKRDDDVDMLKKFSQEDTRRINELDTKRQLLEVEVCQKRDTVERMVAEVRNYEQMQDRTNKLFKQLEEERKALVIQWQDAVKNLRQRDEEIAKMNDDIMLTQAIIDERDAELRDEEKFLLNEKANNRKLEIEIEELNIFNSRLRLQLNEVTQSILTLGNDITTIKRTLASTALKLDQERQLVKEQEKTLATNEAKINGAAVINEELNNKLAEVLSKTLSSTERTKSLNDMIKVDEMMTKNLTTDIEKMLGIVYRSQIALEDLKEFAKRFDIEITGINVAKKKMQKQIKLKMNEVAAQKEMLYHVEYRKNEMEVKIGNIENLNKDDEKTDILNEKIAELEEIFAQHNEVKTFLTGQVNRLDDEMRRLNTAISNDKAKLDTLKNKLQDEMLSFDGGLKQAAAAKLRAQQKQVEENMIRLKVNQLEKAISKEEHHIYDLQKFKLELDTSLKERQIEIATHQDILQAERRNLEESRSRLKADLSLRKIRIEQFQKKHHLALMALGKDDDGQPLSITHIKIREAQERYELQQEGDELDNKVKRTEKEILAMENTLKVVNMTNTVYRKSLEPFEEDNKDRLETTRLEQEICNNATVIKQLKKALTGKRKDLMRIQDALNDIQETHKKRMECFENVQTVYTRLKNERTSREERLHNAHHNAKKYKRQVSKEDLEKPEVIFKII